MHTYVTNRMWLYCWRKYLESCTVPETIICDLCSVVMKTGAYTLQLFYKLAIYWKDKSRNKIQSDLIFVQAHIYYSFPLVSMNLRDIDCMRKKFSGGWVLSFILLVSTR
jgi:hypothetical protein